MGGGRKGCRWEWAGGSEGLPPRAESARASWAGSAARAAPPSRGKWPRGSPRARHSSRRTPASRPEGPSTSRQGDGGSGPRAAWSGPPGGAQERQAPKPLRWLGPEHCGVAPAVRSPPTALPSESPAPIPRCAMGPQAALTWARVSLVQRGSKKQKSSEPTFRWAVYLSGISTTSSGQMGPEDTLPSEWGCVSAALLRWGGMGLLWATLFPSLSSWEGPTATLGLWVNPPVCVRSMGSLRASVGL